MDRAMKNVHMQPYTELPEYHGFFKDHKSGRNWRPLVNGNIGPISSMSEILSLIIRSYNEELKEKLNGGNSIKSTEELLFHFEEYNKSVRNNYIIESESKKFVSSMDIESLYPSLNSHKCAKTVEKVIKESNINVEGLDAKELGIFLRKNLKTSEIVGREFEDFIPYKDKKQKNEKVNAWKFLTLEPNKSTSKQCLLRQ